MPGTPGLEHRLGGLEKDGLGSGNISYDPNNHHEMTVVRQQKVDRIADRLPEIEVDDPTGDADLLLVGWGSTDGPLRAAIHELRERGHSVAHMQLRHLAPLQHGVDDAIKRYRTVLCAENNLGQLTNILRARTLVDIKGHHRVTGLPFSSAELIETATALLEGDA